jgi:hypothetical protein
LPWVPAARRMLERIPNDASVTPLPSIGRERQTSRWQPPGEEPDGSNSCDRNG